MLDGSVQTVAGRISPTEVGVTLMHEHVLIDLSVLVPEPLTTELSIENLGKMAWSPRELLTAANIDMSHVGEAVEELQLFTAAGGSTVVDVTPLFMRRDPSDLAKIAAQSGINLVVSSGFWVDSAIPQRFRDADVQRMADAMRWEFEFGIEGSGLLPGIIGEVGTSSPVTPLEVASLKASVLVQQSTGAAISVHLDPWAEEGVKVAQLLREMGADMSRVVMGHLNPSWEALDYHREIANTGAILGYDLWGYALPAAPGRFPPRDSEAVVTVAALSSEGFADQIVLSHDVSLKTNYTKYGGWGYAHISNHIVPMMLDRGISSDEIDRMLVANPARVLSS